MSDTSERLRVRATALEEDALGFVRACMSETDGGGYVDGPPGMVMVFSVPSHNVANRRLLDSAYQEIEKGFMLLSKALESPRERWELSDE